MLRTGLARGANRTTVAVLLAAVVAAIACAGSSGAAVRGAAGVSSGRADSAWSSLWGLKLAWASQLHPGLLTQLRGAGIRALVVDRGNWTASAHSRLVREARKLGLVIIEPRRAPVGAAAQAQFAHLCGAEEPSARAR